METEELFVGLSLLFILGTGIQWVAWRIKVPSILLLLTTGFIAGPITGWIEPDKLLGDLLFPAVSLSVAIILFEGSLSLRFAELAGASDALRNLLTIGVAITWAIITAAAHWILDFEFSIALVLGAMLVVTGPTVVGPMLRHIRPIGKVGPIARWEGIVVDPIGAVLAVLVFETVEPLRSAAFGAAFSDMSLGLLKTIFIGFGVGYISARFLAELLKRFWIPDHLHSPFTLMLVIASFLVSNLFQHESGLLTVTVMGVVLANQRTVVVKHILEFKETLTVLLISTLFILLSARVELSGLTEPGIRGLFFVLAVLFVARPTSVFLSTIGCGLTMAERLFLSWLAPRGIVAAAVASLFALSLGPEGAGLVHATFWVIIATVSVYGLTAFPLARKLGLATDDPQGVLIASAHPGARAIAHALQGAGFTVAVVDTNHHHTQSARMEGLKTYHANILSEHLEDHLDLGGIGYFLALTPNDEVNSLAAGHYCEVFGRSKTFQLPSQHESQRNSIAEHHFGGRFLFGSKSTYNWLDERFAAGAVVKTTQLTEEFDFESFQQQYGSSAKLLFTITETGKLIVNTDQSAAPSPGQKVIALVDPSPT